jgi:hypothetical protein
VTPQKGKGREDIETKAVLLMQSIGRGFLDRKDVQKKKQLGELPGQKRDEEAVKPHTRFFTPEEVWRRALAI